MLDARILPNGTVLESTVCIVGAGAAGITLACTLLAQNIPVCLVESGGFSYELATDKLARGESVGVPYNPAQARFRFFGGSSNAWGGLVRPLSAHCFAKRDWVGDVSWPFELSYLEPYYDRALKLLNIQAMQYEADARLSVLGRRNRNQLVLNDTLFETRLCALADPKVFKDTLRAQLSSSADLKLLLHANAVNIDTPSTCREVSTITVRTLCGKTHYCKARAFVLALGGIENARILLLSDKYQNTGLGNAHDLVGRYFMDHPRLICGRFRPLHNDIGLEFYNPGSHFDQTPAVASLSPSVEVQRKEKLLDSRFYIVPIYRGQDGPGFDELTWLRWSLRATHNLGLWKTDFGRIIRDLPHAALGVVGQLGKFRPLMKHFALSHVIEQAPNRDSRITLSVNRDALGCRRVCVDWQLGELEKHTIVRTQELFANALRESKLGTMEVERNALSTDPLPFLSSWHHMGTTRMDPDPKRGVVDRDCRLHGTCNLFIAGSSVFPTGGDDVPTLTIVALAIRLADHIAKQIAKGCG